MSWNFQTPHRSRALRQRLSEKQQPQLLVWIIYSLNRFLVRKKLTVGPASVGRNRNVRNFSRIFQIIRTRFTRLIVCSCKPWHRFSSAVPSTPIHSNGWERDDPACLFF